MGTRKTIPADEIRAALQRLAEGISARHAKTEKLVLLGIADGGVPVARRIADQLASLLKRPVSRGVINVSFHRDDLGLNPIPKMTSVTEIPEDLTDSTVILVDDVFFSGRTVRAAMEEVFANGRPARVELATLVDRGNRRLPIAADYVGIVEDTRPEEQVLVRLDEDDAAADTITISNPT